jgi:hypothetical protein
MVMLGAVIVWAVLGAVSRLWGAVMGALMAVGLAGWGFMTMGTGRGVTILGLRKPLAPEIFYGICVLLLVINVVGVMRGWRQWRRTQRG